MSTMIARDRVSIVAVGATGQGKSTLGNALACLETPAFEVSDSFDSQTRLCSHADFDADGHEYRFVDTVGFFDTKMTPEMVYGKFVEFADRAPGGVDAFLYVEQKGRFNDEQLRRFNVFKEYVGTEALQHTIIVFTRIEDERLKLQFKSDEEACRMPSQLREVLGQVRTAVGVESLDSPEKARQAVLEAVQSLVQQNNGVTYSNKALTEASERRQALQEIVAGFSSSDRKALMQAALKGLYDGSRTYDEVHGSIKCAQVTEEKEHVEFQFSESEQRRAELDIQRLKLELDLKQKADEACQLKADLEREQEEHQNQISRSTAELERERQQHCSQMEEQRRLEQERCHQVEQDKLQREEGHRCELAQQATMFEEHKQKLESELKKSQDEARSVSRTFELQKEENRRSQENLGQRAKEQEQLVIEKEEEMQRMRTILEQRKGIIAQQSDNMEMLELRQKLLGATFALGVLVLGFKWSRS